MSVTRVLVTGGTGVIAAWVVRGFVERGIQPVVFSRGSSDQVGLAINGDIRDAIVSVRGDLRDHASLEAAVRQHAPEAIVHMASAKPWQIEPPFVAEPRPQEAVEQIVTATANVLDVARRAGIRRVVYASSKAVYGDIVGRFGAPTFEPLPADYPCEPRMLYGVGKLAAEQLGFYYARQFGLEFLALRFSSSFGPLKRGPKETSPDGMLLAALEDGVARVRRFPPGECDDFAYNKDIAEGFVLAALAEKPRHRAYNLGSGQGVTHVEIARAIGHVLPAARLELTEPQTASMGTAITDRARCIMDISPAQADFGYRPRYVPLELAFEDFLREEHRMRSIIGAHD